jgi:hypothetical protein
MEKLPLEDKKFIIDGFRETIMDDDLEDLRAGIETILKKRKQTTIRKLRRFKLIRRLERNHLPTQLESCLLNIICDHDKRYASGACEEKWIFGWPETSFVMTLIYHSNASATWHEFTTTDLDWKKTERSFPDLSREKIILALKISLDLHTSFEFENQDINEFFQRFWEKEGINFLSR